MIEVVARIGESTIDLAHLDAAGSYHVGNTPGVDLAVPGIGRFPLVDGGLVRIPAGMPATVRGLRIDSRTLRASAEPIAVALGLATVEIRTLERAHQPIARPRVDWRMVIYVLVSLVAQVALWAAAVTLAPFHDPPPKVIVRPVHVTHPPPPPLPKPKPVQAPQVQVQAQPKAPPGEHVHERSAPATSGMAQVHQFIRNWKTPDVQLDGTGAGPDDYTSNDYGNSKHFDPTSDPKYASVKVDKWAIPTAGKMLGQTLPPPKIEWCDDDSCLTQGPIALATFLNELDRHRKQISDCYVDHTDSLEGSIRLRFFVTPDGRARAATPQLHGDQVELKEGAPLGTGIGTIGRCVAKVIDRAKWPKASEETSVWIGIRFTAGDGPIANAQIIGKGR